MRKFNVSPVMGYLGLMHDGINILERSSIFTKFVQEHAFYD